MQNKEFATRLGLEIEAVYHVTMKSILLLHLIISSFSFAGLPNASAPSDANEIVKKADEARYPSGQFSFFVKVTDTDDSNQNETVYLVHTKDSDNSLVETKSPERMRGRKLLMKKRDLWMFLPNLKKPTRVGFEQRLTGEVSNGDLARTNFAEDYDAKLVGEEKVDSHNCYKLLLSANHKETTYRQIVYWVDKSSFFPVQVKFYALSGKLLKTGKYSGVKTVLDKSRVTQLIITDALHKTRQSTLNYFNFRKANYDDTFFSKESLSD